MKGSRDITRVISFTSGKGGAGKTNCVVNVGASLAGMGRSVLILDADFGLANVDVILGIRPKGSLEDFFKGRVSLSEIIVKGPAGVDIIPAASGVESMCQLDTAERLMLMEAVEEIGARYDYLLIDTQAGIGADVMFFNSASSEIVCVINPEITSLTDAYAMIKVLASNYGEEEITILANNVPGEVQAERAFNRLSGAVERFLQVKLKYVGFVPRDPLLEEALKEQRALVELFPSGPGARGFAKVAEQLDSEFFSRRVKGGMQFFFRQLLEVGAHGR